MSVNRHCRFRRQICDRERSQEIVKYDGVTMEIQLKLDVRTKVIPVIRGTSRTISESLRKYLNNIPGKHNIQELQKTAFLGTAHTIREVVM